MIKRVFIFSVLAVAVATAYAQISITSSTPYTQDFNSLPTADKLSTNPYPSGWFRYDKPGSAAGDTIRVTTGTTTSGGFYSVGDDADPERAFGLLLSSSTKPLYLGAMFVNNTGSTIVSATVSYRCEQWRRGNNTLGRFDTLLVDYSTTADSVYKGSWTNVPQLSGRSVDSSTTTGALDGNTDYRNVSYTITGLAVADNDPFWLRFNDFDISGSEDILAVDDFSISFTTGSVSPCTAPTNSVTDVVASGTGSTSIGGTFTGTTADGYLVVADESATAPTITDGTSYAPGDPIGTGKVIGFGSSTTFTGFGLTPETVYHVFVFPYNNLACSGGPSYKATDPGTDTAKTFVLTLSDCTQPSGVSSSSIIKLDSTTTTISIQWTNPANADSILVFAAPTNTVGFVTLHDSVYYGVGATIPSNGSTPPTVYYRGTGTTTTLTGLEENTVYKIFVVSFNNKSCTNGPNYAGLSTKTIRTDAGSDCTQPSGVSNTSIVKLDSTVTTIQIKWTNPANADSVLVFAAPTNTVGFVTLHDSVYYGVGDVVPSDGSTQPIVYYRGVDSSATLTSLVPNTVYKIFIAAFNNASCTNGPNYAGIATTTIRTALSTGIKINKETAFVIYPNPVKEGSLSIQFAKPLAAEADLEIVDMTGRKVLNLHLSTDTKTQNIDVSTLSKGVYYLNIWYKNDNSTVPFVVQ